MGRVSTLGMSEIQPLTLTIMQARQLTGLGHDMMFRLIRSKQLDVVKIGGRTLIRFSSLQALIENGTPEVPRYTPRKPAVEKPLAPIAPIKRPPGRPRKLRPETV